MPTPVASLPSTIWLLAAAVDGWALAPINILFEPLDYGSAGILRSEIADVLNRYEPRIRVNTINCIPDEMSNGYEVELSYTIVGRDDTPVAVEFFLERTR